VTNPPPHLQPGPQLPAPVSGTLWVLVTLFAVCCGVPLLCWAIMLFFGGIGTLLPE
jgi:hypothetical protein